jgi:hypothetical protein
MLTKYTIDCINKIIVHKKNEMKIFDYQPNKKFLTIIACHLNTEFRLNILIKNIEYLSFLNNDIIIINSCHLPFNTEVKDKINIINEKNRTSYKYIEINNNKWIDSGKWFHVLTEMNLQLDLYDFITFTNDSFEIYSPIYYFFNLASYHNVDLFAYTSSSEITYHYQTYLFIIKSSGIPMFIDFIKNFMEKNSNSNGYEIEISIINLFSNKKCFLDIGVFVNNYKKNIFFHNRFLYSVLFKSKVLPFIKIKQIHNYNKKLKLEFNLSPSKK